MQIKYLGFAFLTAACLQLVSARIIYKIKKSGQTEENDMKVKKINRISVALQLSALAVYVGIFMRNRL